MKKLSEQDIEDAREWIRSRPASVRSLIRRFPPCCLVKATQPLLCPRPGTVGMVVSYSENGDIAVIQYNPDEYAVVPIGTRAQCRPEWLEVVGHSAPYTPEWTEEALMGLVE